MAAPVLGALGEVVTGEAECRCNFAGGKPRERYPGRAEMAVCQQDMKHWPHWDCLGPAGHRAGAG